MPFNFEELKQHPYAVGGVIIVGALIVFYYLSQQGSSNASSIGSSSDYSAADATIQQANAAAAIQTNAQNAQIQQSQIAASVANNQTAAQVSTQNTSVLAGLIAALSGNQTGLQVAQVNANAATLQQANQEVSQQNIYSLQEAGLQDQINQASIENANNNATSLAGFVDQLNAQGAIAAQSLNIAGGLATTQQQQYAQEVSQIIPLAGQQKNSALDATDQTSLFQTILSGGNASVAAAGTNASASAANSGNAAGASKFNSITNGITSLASGFFGA